LITIILILYIAIAFIILPTHKTHALKCNTTVGRNAYRSATDDDDDGRDDNGHNEDDDTSVYTLFMQRAQRTE